jgi:hypothetical protein
MRVRLVLFFAAKGIAMRRHVTAVFKKFFLLSDHKDPQADTQLRTYIRWYEWVARTGYFITICLVGLGLGSTSQLIDSALQTVANIRNGSIEFSTGISKLAAPFLSNPPGILLAVITVAWHHAYLRHVKNETGIVESCFEKDQKPHWHEVSGAKFAPFIGAWLFLAFSGLCLLVGQIKWYALVAIILNLGDFAGNEFTKNNLLRAFRSKQFRTRSKILLGRRQIALEYWSEKWQFTRILMMFMINVLAVTIAHNLFGVHIPDVVPYALVAIGIVVNEYIITTWRIERDTDLRKFPVSSAGPEEAGAKIEPPTADQKRPKRKRARPRTDAGE